MIEVPELYVTVQTLQNISNKLNISNWAIINRTSCDSAQWNQTIDSKTQSIVKCNCTFENGSVCHVTSMYVCFLYRKYSRIVILPLAKAMIFIYYFHNKFYVLWKSRIPLLEYPITFSNFFNEVIVMAIRCPILNINLCYSFNNKNTSTNVFMVACFQGNNWYIDVRQKKKKKLMESRVLYGFIFFSFYLLTNSYILFLTEAWKVLIWMEFSQRN